jgi:Putative peptidoglycan binding domain
VQRVIAFRNVFSESLQPESIRDVKLPEGFMKRTQFSVLFLIAAVLPSIHIASGQAINATMQSTSPRVATARPAPAVGARPNANAPVAPHVVSRPTGFTPYAPRMSQFVPNISRNHSPYIVRSLGPTVASMSAQPGVRIGDQPAITLDPATRQTELHTLAAMRERRDFGISQPIAFDPTTREIEARTLSAMREHHGMAAQNQTLATIDPRPRAATHDPAMTRPPETQESLEDAPPKKSHHKKGDVSFEEAFRRHWHEWHDRNWWHNNCQTIVFVNTGYYFLDGSYWYPAWGYDPLQTYYDYDGPVYTYSNLLPDEVIANVQTALQDAGYYYGEITGSLGVDTRAALANFQRDYGLPITGAIDESTVEALGLY